MEDFTEDTPLDTGPRYFFDQLKPERKTWIKRKCEDHVSRWRNTSRAKYCHKKKIESKRLEVRLSTVSDEEEEFHSLGTLQSSNVLKFSMALQVSKKYQQKHILEEYKLISSKILSELGKMLQKYAECNMTLPVGIANLINYSWEELTKGAYNKKHTSKNLLLKQDKALQRDSKSMPVADLKGYTITSYSGEECHKENHLVIAEKEHVALSKSLEKLSFVNQNHCFHESSLPLVIHFSLSSKTCLEDGWIFPYPYSKSETLKWKTVLSSAVKKLQVAIIQRKQEEAKLKKEGFTKQLILRHYNDPRDELEVGKDGHMSRCFWFELLKGKPQMPQVKKDDPMMKKFHYALVDGSSLTYYPSGRLAVCQSYSNLPWGGVYTNIFSDLPKQAIVGTFTPFGCGSISFSNGKVIAMMFNQDGGLVLNKDGYVIREWVWSSKGKLDDPVEIWVNKFIIVKISGRFAITLVYKWQPQSLTLSLAPVRHKPFPPCLPEAPASLMYPTDTLDSAMDISPMSDIETVTKLRSLQRKVKCLLFQWLDHYRFASEVGSRHICQMLELPQKVVRKQTVPSVNVLLEQHAKEINIDKEYLRFRNTFLELKGVFKPLPVRCIQKTPISNQPFRLPLFFESSDASFASQLDCPVVLRRTLCGKEGLMCRCSTLSIPEVTDLEYDYLINKQLSSMDQIIVVCVFSPNEKDKAIKEVAHVHRELNRSRNMPCIQSHLDPFRLLKYNIISASKYTGSNCPLLVQRHNVIPGIFLMYIRGKLLFANFIFNGYSTSAKDLQKQIVKTRNDYHMGYFLPNDFRVRPQSTSF